MIPAKFLTTLQVRRASDGEAGAWELTAPLLYSGNVLPHVVIVPAGFRTDFASVPRVPFAYLLFGNVADEAAVLHDYAYTSEMTGITRKQADALFLEACKAMGTPSWKSRPMWLAVRLFGGRFWGSRSPLPLPKDAP